ncbi:hypothetical protein [Rhizobium leguminosarum]|uniref:Uncharacterized protein n=1 Tax=Rhizobium leguminosarum TaxID=384 RepID=A0A7W9ZQ47_RHILE|nr:hypothetical protein [Rhizobium leguminosarum]MBB6219424.1 hypothetical protein [Rhizobium leguminosarum]
MLIFEADEVSSKAAEMALRTHEKLSPELPWQCTFSIDLRLQRPFVMRCEIAAEGVDEKKSRHREYQCEDNEKRSLQLHGGPRVDNGDTRIPVRRGFLP